MFYIAVFVPIFIIVLRDKCDIQNRYCVPEDKTKEIKCLKCDLNCKKCHGSISHNQCDTYFASFIPSFENNKIKFCNKKCEVGENNACNVYYYKMNECLYCNFGYFMPEDEEKKVECQKCAVDYCDKCSGQKIQINANLVLVLIPLYMKEMKLLNVYVKLEKKKNV